MSEWASRVIHLLNDQHMVSGRVGGGRRGGGSRGQPICIRDATHLNVGLLLFLFFIFYYYFCSYTDITFSEEYDLIVRYRLRS